jgi:predicted DNA-binding ribbon-helix-helix protein
MESAVAKHSIVIAGHRTSVSLEKEFWNALKEIAHAKHMTLSDLVALIDSDRQHGNLSSAIRLFVLGFYRHQNWLGASKRQSGRAPATDRSASVLGIPPRRSTPDHRITALQKATEEASS